MYTIARNLAIDYQKQANVRLVDGIGDWQKFEQMYNQDIKDEGYRSFVTNEEFSNFCEAIRQLPI